MPEEERINKLAWGSTRSPTSLGGPDCCSYASTRLTRIMEGSNAWPLEECWRATLHCHLAFGDGRPPNRGFVYRICRDKIEVHKKR